MFFVAKFLIDEVVRQPAEYRHGPLRDQLVARLHGQAARYVRAAQLAGTPRLRIKCFRGIPTAVPGSEFLRDAASPKTCVSCLPAAVSLAAVLHLSHWFLFVWVWGIEHLFLGAGFTLKIEPRLLNCEVLTSWRYLYRSMSAIMSYFDSSINCLCIAASILRSEGFCLTR